MRKIIALLLLLVMASAAVAANATSEIEIRVLAPENKTYEGVVPLEVEASMDNLFLHNATVTVTIGDNVYTLPEGQNSYRSEANLSAGYYTAVVNINETTETVSFTVAGEVGEGNETIVYPGLKRMTIERTSPTRAQYAPGEQTDITVYLIDLSAERVDDATVVAVVRTPDDLEHSIALSETMIGGKTVYKNKYIFSLDGFYEIMITAEKSGYEQAALYMPTIQIGEEKPVLPSDVYCEFGLCLRVESPSEIETYPDGSSVEFRLQVFEEATAAPVADATAVALFGNESLPLGYDWNGYYANTSYNMSEGNYLVSFQVQKGGLVIEKNISLHISPDQLVIQPIVPVPGGNVTETFLTMQMKLTDQDGEIVTGANVRVIMTTPLTGTRTVPMMRNAATGFYEAEYTFADAGQYTAKVVASKIGYVSSESVYTFEVMMEPEGVQLTEQDVVIAALIIGVLIIIVTLGKALL